MMMLGELLILRSTLLSLDLGGHSRMYSIFELVMLVFKALGLHTARIKGMMNGLLMHWLKVVLPTGADCTSGFCRLSSFLRARILLVLRLRSLFLLPFPKSPLRQVLSFLLFPWLFRLITPLLLVFHHFDLSRVLLSLMQLAEPVSDPLIAEQLFLSTLFLKSFLQILLLLLL